MKQSKISMEFIKYVSLNVMSMIGLSCYIFADTLFIANGVGSKGLTALNLVLPVYSILNGFGLMLGMGAATRYSVQRGERKQGEADRIFTNVCKIAVIIGIIFTVAGVFGAEKIAALLGAKGDILPLGASYLRTELSFSLAFILNNVMICFVRNDENPKLAMLAMLVGSFINILLDYVFIFPLQMGMAGAALATGLAPIIGLSLLSIHKIQRKNHFHLIRIKLGMDDIQRILSLGSGSFVNELSSAVVMLLFNFTILKLRGNIGVAAYGVIANLALIVVAIFTGIGQGIQPILSRSYGEKNIESIQKIYQMAIGLAFILGIAIYTGCSLFPEELAGIFNNSGSHELLQIAKEGIRIYFLAFLFMGFNIVTIAFLAAVEQGKTAFVLSLLRGGGLILPLILILPVFLSMKGVWIVIPLTEILTAAASFFVIRKRNKFL